MCWARFEGKVPGEGEYGPEEKALIAELQGRVEQYTEFLENAEFRKAMSELRAIWVTGNEYLTRAAPWTHIKTDRARAAVGVRMGLNLVHIFAHLVWPIMPDMAKKIHDAIQPIGYENGAIPWVEMNMAKVLDELEAGQPINSPDVLVVKFSDEQIEELKIKFSGSSE